MNTVKLTWFLMKTVFPNISEPVSYHNYQRLSKILPLFKPISQYMTTKYCHKARMLKEMQNLVIIYTPYKLKIRLCHNCKGYQQDVSHIVPCNHQLCKLKCDCGRKYLVYVHIESNESKYLESCNLNMDDLKIKPFIVHIKNEKTDYYYGYYGYYNSIPYQID